MDELTLSRVEDASLNASAPPQQRWLDGWLVRLSPGKAKRARCVNAVAPGRLPLHERLRLAALAFDDAGLPLVVRITRFTQPPDLDPQLAALGYTVLDDTRVMVRGGLRNASPQAPPALPHGLVWARLPPERYAAEVGALRGSPLQQVHAHAQRLAHSPVPYAGHALCRQSDGAVLACGQYAREADLVGLYDIFTRPEARGQGLAMMLCERLLSLSAAEGAEVAYLQVEADNTAARRIYARLGFAEGYRYHYRLRP
jgi:ribosomal protein S18 acetylase RimI-like enzyme